MLTYDDVKKKIDEAIEVARNILAVPIPENHELRKQLENEISLMEATKNTVGFPHVCRLNIRDIVEFLENVIFKDFHKEFPEEAESLEPVFVRLSNLLQHAEGYCEILERSKYSESEINEKINVLFEDLNKIRRLPTVQKELKDDKSYAFFVFNYIEDIMKDVSNHLDWPRGCKDVAISLYRYLSETAITRFTEDYPTVSQDLHNDQELSVVVRSMVSM